MWLGNDEVLQSATVIDGKLAVTFGQGWEEWLCDGRYPEFKELTATLNEKLTNVASKGVGKAASKGGHAGKGKRPATE